MYHNIIFLGFNLSLDHNRTKIITQTPIFNSLNFATQFIRLFIQGYSQSMRL